MTNGVAKSMSRELRQYLWVTFNYWNFTLTDGALRMLVVLYFHQLGYAPFEVAMLFLFYELFGVVTNLIGGWLGARVGLNRIMNIGLALQVVALTMLTVPSEYLSVVYVMMAQALSGIAKDLNKMSAKSSIKLLLPDSQQGLLFKWVAILTGSKNTLKGIGFFLGGLLLMLFGFQMALALMAAVLSLVFLLSLFFLQADLGRAKTKPKFSELFSKSETINILSAARLCLFAARDVWFVVALPIYLAATLGWSHTEVGAFLALWIILYGGVQTIAPKVIGTRSSGEWGAVYWAAVLTVLTALIALAVQSAWHPGLIITLGLFLFGAVFAVNSSLHSYLIVRSASRDGVSLDVGFYYMANAMGRLIGTLLSGYLFQRYGLAACLWISALLLLATVIISLRLPRRRC
ncbi:putative MFS family arabinose efflux permease [Sinobacterium caligoides]|uniref:Putative MFS family arabinose efflux permease n=1 Tax=Sinobacterium caligoides TaxID=933926 RepID=A0A3N2DMV0_9GAMM|nr:organoarsenical effux MFS transporter ArsJ [Sinobacterium caligoides]ROS01134.1 putative MFS family arabinose efflux permease [Sinobacterium caligoides]